MKISLLTIIPLSSSLMLYPSLNLNVRLDGAQTVYSGFPIPWNSDSLVTSLAKDIYLIPLVIDLFFYFSVVFVIYRYLSPKLYWLPKKIKQSIILVVWIFGAFALWFIVTISTMEPASTIAYWPESQVFEILEINVGSSI